jgi:hypothetical protein
LNNDFRKSEHAVTDFIATSTTTNSQQVNLFDVDCCSRRTALLVCVLGILKGNRRGSGVASAFMANAGPHGSLTGRRSFLGRKNPSLVWGATRVI